MLFHFQFFIIHFPFIIEKKLFSAKRNLAKLIIRKNEEAMIEVVNRQRKIKITVKVWSEFTSLAMDKIDETTGKDLTVAFVSDNKMLELNSFFRGKNVTTDVLSFPFEPDEVELSAESSALADGRYLGDIVISLEQAQRQALENNLDFETELKQLILHGILHLCGYDHETDGGEMNRRELELRDKLDI